MSELTGRKGRLVRNGAGSPVYEKRTHGLRDGKDQQVAMDRVNLTERAAFLEGRKQSRLIGSEPDILTRVWVPNSPQALGC